MDLKMSNQSDSEGLDVVIVLANQMDSSGALNLESRARAEKAIKVLSEKKIPSIVTCGWAYRSDSDIKIANAFKAYIVNTLGMDPKRVITELNSRDTVGDAFFTKTKLAIPCGWRKICVVTSEYHVPRTKEIFKFIYGDEFDISIFGVNVEFDDNVIQRELASIRAFRKTFFGVESGNDSQILSRLRECHPFYNGQIFEKI